MDNRYLTTALFAQEFDDLFNSFIVVTHYHPDKTGICGVGNKKVTCNVITGTSDF